MSKLVINNQMTAKIAVIPKNNSDACSTFVPSCNGTKFTCTAIEEKKRKHNTTNRYNMNFEMNK